MYIRYSPSSIRFLEKAGRFGLSQHGRHGLFLAKEL